MCHAPEVNCQAGVLPKGIIQPEAIARGGGGVSFHGWNIQDKEHRK